MKYSERYIQINDNNKYNHNRNNSYSNSNNKNHILEKENPHGYKNYLYTDNATPLSNKLNKDINYGNFIYSPISEKKNYNRYINGIGKELGIENSIGINSIKNR
jgi:hypothetical protein